MRQQNKRYTLSDVRRRELLEAALAGYTLQARQLEQRIQELKEQLGGHGRNGGGEGINLPPLPDEIGAVVPAEKPRVSSGRRRLSAAGRRAIVSAQIKRWAERKKQEQKRAAIMRKALTPAKPAKASKRPVVKTKPVRPVRPVRPVPPVPVRKASTAHKAANVRKVTPVKKAPKPVNPTPVKAAPVKPAPVKPAAKDPTNPGTNAA